MIMNLKAYLANVGMTSKDFSVLVNCNQRYLSKIMNGHVLPGKRLAKEIEDLTGGEIKFSRNKKETGVRI
jgi:hypothetical protein